MNHTLSNKPSFFKAWLSAFRLRTLPLALASILMGSLLASAHHTFSWPVFLLCALTTVLLQILSNLANDYGDSVHGADSKDRQGPKRAVQTGLISPQSMKRAMILFSLLSLISGLSLLYISLSATIETYLFFFGVGILAIVAAITYTSGKNPYGYAGLGDVSVLLFFGFTGVLGTYYLHTQQFAWDLLWAAASCGFFATAVLNVNNIRDIASDAIAGKKSIPVRLGPKRARIYHVFLLIGGLISASVYVCINFTSPVQFIYLVAAPFLFINGLNVWRKQRPAELDPYLKQMALTTLLFALSFGLGQFLAAIGY